MAASASWPRAPRGRNCVEDDGEGGLGEAGDLDGGADGLEVEQVGTAGDEDEVGGAGGGEGGALGVGRGVETAKVGALLFGLFEDDREAIGLGGLDDGSLVLAEILPGGGAGLGIEVDEDAGLAGTLGGDGEMEREGGFAHAPLLEMIATVFICSCHTGMAGHCNMLLCRELEV